MRITGIMLPPAHQQLLSQHGVHNQVLLGKGMQSMVYDYAQDKIIKIYVDPNINIDRIHELRKFYESLSRDSLQVDFPQLLEVGTYHDLHFTIEKKLEGERALSVFTRSNPEIKARLLDNYFQLLEKLSKIELDGDYGELLTGHLPKVVSSDWRIFIKQKLEESRVEATKKPDHDIKNVSLLFEKYFQEILPKIESKPKKNLVHGDLFLENVLAEKNGEITALLDFGPLSVLGDHLMDVAGLVYFPTVSEGVEQETSDYLEQLAFQKYPNMQETMKNYLLYYSLFFINSKSYDPRTHAWCLRNLTLHGFVE
ncbi:MAG: phosphotransferase [Microgenomates group bacterium]